MAAELRENESVCLYLHCIRSVLVPLSWMFVIGRRVRELLWFCGEIGCGN